MAEAWKTYFHYSTPRAVGVITVFAISGSVLLLSIGKQAMLLFRNYVLETIEDGRDGTRIEDSPSQISFPSSSEKSKLEQGDLNLRKDSQNCENVCSTAAFPTESCSVASTEDSSSDTGYRQRPFSKKVRFAADVIEPLGNSQEYRRRMKSAFLKKGDANQQMGQNCKTQNGKRMSRLVNSSIPANRMALYNGLQQEHRMRRALYYYC